MTLKVLLFIWWVWTLFLSIAWIAAWTIGREHLPATVSVYQWFCFDLTFAIAYPVGAYVWKKKGDILAMGSLTRGRAQGNFLVSKIEWAMDQQSGNVHAWITVRKVAK